jgi:predicted MPP superfamily phosphohydrolase
MKSLVFFTVVSVFLFSYGALNYYIGLRGWQAFGGIIPFLNIKVYWLIFSLLALSYLPTKISLGVLPRSITKGLTFIGSYWLAVMFYLILALPVLDLVRLLDKRLCFLPVGISQNPNTPHITGFVFLFLITSLLVYGSWNSRTPRISHYDLEIHKKAGDLKTLHLVMASDLHLGNIVGSSRLSKMVDMINELKPDLVVLPGDIIDENVQPFLDQNMADIFRRLTPKFGVYAVLGNHEYIGGQSELSVKALQEAGIRVLRDETVKINDSFYIAGRDYRSVERFSGNPRLELETLINGIDKSLPIIILDHVPLNLEEAQEMSIDLQLSGHTHRGQFFPNHLVTGKIFEIDWGYLQKESLHVIVTSGFGTWGPPIRIGNTPEIVDVVINFKDPSLCSE